MFLEALRQVKVVRKKRKDEVASSSEPAAGPAKPLIARQEALQKAKAKVGTAKTFLFLTRGSIIS